MDNQKTETLGLELITDPNTQFKDWRESLNGCGTTELEYSSLQKIDKFAADVLDTFTNYYTKSETKDNYYDKSEVNQLISDISNIDIVIVNSIEEIDEPGHIYLLPKEANVNTDQPNSFYEYIYIEGQGPELIGSTEINLSDYYTKDEITELLNIALQKIINNSSLIDIILKDLDLDSVADGNYPTNSTRVSTSQKITTLDSAINTFVGELGLENLLDTTYPRSEQKTVGQRIIDNAIVLLDFINADYLEHTLTEDEFKLFTDEISKVRFINLNTYKYLDSISLSETTVIEGQEETDTYILKTIDNSVYVELIKITNSSVDPAAISYSINLHQ